MRTFELYAPGPAYNFTSYDPHSHAVQIFLSLTGANWEQTKVPPYLTSAEKLPLLKDGTLFVNGAFQVMNHLEKEGYTMKSSLSKEEELKAYATASYLDSKLQDIIAYYRYIDQENFLSSTRPCLAKILPFVSRYFVPGKLVEQAQERLEAYQQCVEIEKENRKKFKISSLSLEYLKKVKDAKSLDPLEAKILELNRLIIGDISALLANNNFLFGNSMHKFDLIIACQIAHILYPALKNSAAADYIKLEHPGIIDYCDRVLSKSPSTSEVTDSKSCDFSWGMPRFGLPTWLTNIYPASTSPTSPLSDEERELAKSRAYSIITAVVSLSAYLIYHGLLSSGEETMLEEDYDDEMDETLGLEALEDDE